MLHNYDEIMSVMLPTLGPERRATYSPFMPVCPDTGHVLQVPTISVDYENETITYKNESGRVITTEVTDGKCKLQWKVDFGMRWAALEVDFEMYGKDHLANSKIYSSICKVLGKRPPTQMFYEMFLDQEGKKISKSKGNGISLEEWLRYAPQESLALFSYKTPQKAKKLYFDVIPKNVDEYITYVQKYHAVDATDQEKYDNPVYHVHKGNVPHYHVPVNYSLLLNLIEACNSSDPEVLFAYINKMSNNDKEDDATGNGEFVKKMVESAINYYNDFVKPYKKYKTPTDNELLMFKKLIEELRAVMSNAGVIEDADHLQGIIFSIAKESDVPAKQWFSSIYEVLFGNSRGPRIGSFIALYGVENTIALIEDRIGNNKG